MMMRDFIYKILSTATARIINLFLSIIILMITARYLGPEGRGLIAATTTWVGLYFTILCFSISPVTIYIYASAHVHEKKEIFLQLRGAHRIFVVSLTLIGWFILILTYLFTPNIYKGIPFDILILSFLLLPFMILENYQQSLLQCVDRVKTINVAMVMNKSIAVVVLVFLVGFMKIGVYGVLIAYLAGQALVYIYQMVSINNVYKKVVYNLTLVKKMLVQSVKLHLNAIASFFFTSTDIIMLNYFRSTSEVGIYQLAVQLMSLLLIIPQSASVVTYSKVAELGVDNAWPYQRKIMLIVMGLLSIIMCFIYFLSPWIVLLLAGREFLESSSVFRYLIIASFGQSISILFAPQWIGRGIFITVSILSLITAIANVIMNFFFIPVHGIYGAVWSTIITSFGLVLGNLYLYRKHVVKTKGRRANVT